MPYSAKAVEDFEIFMTLAKSKPAAAEAFKNHLQLRLPVIVSDVNRCPTVAFCGVAHVKLHEALMSYLSA